MIQKKNALVVPLCHGKELSYKTRRCLVKHCFSGESISCNVITEFISAANILKEICIDRLFTNHMKRTCNSMCNGKSHFVIIIPFTLNLELREIFNQFINSCHKTFSITPFIVPENLIIILMQISHCLIKSVQCLIRPMNTIPNEQFIFKIKKAIWHIQKNMFYGIILVYFLCTGIVLTQKIIYCR